MPCKPHYGNSHLGRLGITTLYTNHDFTYLESEFFVLKIVTDFFSTFIDLQIASLVFNTTNEIQLSI